MKYVRTTIAFFLVCVLIFSCVSCSDSREGTDGEAVARLEKEISALNETGRVFAEAVAALQEADKSLREDIAALKSGSTDGGNEEGTAAEDAVARLEKEIGGLKDADKLLAEAVTALNEANEALKESVALLEVGDKGNQQDADTGKAITRLEKEISTLNETNKKLADAVAALKEANDTLQKDIAALKGSGAGSKTDETGEVVTKKSSHPINGVYSADELKKLSLLPMDEARKKISTVEDAAHYLGLQGFDFYSGTSPQELNLSLSFAQQKLKNKVIADNTAAALAAYLLSDDYKDLGYVTAPVNLNGNMWGMAGLYIGSNGKYYVASVSQIMRIQGYRMQSGAISFDTMTLGKLTEVKDKLRLTDMGSGTSPVQLLTAAYQETLVFTYGNDIMTVTAGKAQEIYRLSDAERNARKKEQLTSLASELKRQKYTSKGLTITVDEAVNLVGSGLENVRKKCKSLEDVLLFLCATGSKQASGDIQTRDSGGNYTWHFNYSPEMVYSMNTSNCGGTASYVAYLLEGDYDEVGMLTMRAEDGGHVINYFCDANAWISVDVNAFHGSGYNLNTIEYNKGSDLISVGRRAAHRYKSSFATPHLSSDPKEGDVPVGWDSTMVVRIPAEYRKTTTIVLETPEEGFTFEWVNVSDNTWAKINALRNG